MSLHIPTSSRPEVTPPIVYPESDGEPLAETEVHILAIIDFIATLRFHYRSRRDIYVIGNMFLYYEEGNPRARKAPDLMVVKGVDTSQPRRIFKVWEEKAVPCVIIEFTSKSTCDEDQGDKKAVYAHLRVREMAQQRVDRALLEEHVGAGISRTGERQSFTYAIGEDA